MVDRANVIFDIERCICHVPDACRDCSKYNAKGVPTLTCMESLMSDALKLLKEQESEWLEDSDPGQVYGTTWACAECGCSIHERTVWNPYRAGFKYCPFCGDRMVLKRDD